MWGTGCSPGPLARNLRWPRSRGRAACYNVEELKVIPQTFDLLEEMVDNSPEQHLTRNTQEKTQLYHHAGRGTRTRESS